MRETISFLEELDRRGEKVHGMSAREAAERLRRAAELSARIIAENPRHPNAAKGRYEP